MISGDLEKLSFCPDSGLRAKKYPQTQLYACGKFHPRPDFEP
jgi:hypothetical protein